MIFREIETRHVAVPVLCFKFMAKVKEGRESKTVVVVCFLFLLLFFWFCFWAPLAIFHASFFSFFFWGGGAAPHACSCALLSRLLRAENRGYSQSRTVAGVHGYSLEPVLIQS